MTTPRPSVTPHVRVLIPFIILSDSDDEVTTLPIRHAPPSPDYVLASPNYSPDSNLDSDPLKDDSPGDDLTETVKSLQTQAASPLVVHPSPTLLPSSSSPPSLLSSSSSPPPSLLPSSSSPPPSLLPSSSSPPPSLLPSSSSPPPLPFPSSSRKRPRSPSPPPPEVVVPKATATTTPVRLYRMVEAIVGPLLWTVSMFVDTKRIEGIRDHQREIVVARSESDERIETLEQEVETLRVKVKDAEARLQKCEADMRELRKLEDHFGM
nr:hypothetical protein [Tanacetum cinerariifolium]